MKLFRPIAGLTILSVLLSSCGGDASVEQKELRVFSAKNGVASSLVTSISARTLGTLSRPSAPLGMFVSSFLSQGAFITVKSAVMGVDSQQRIISGQAVPTSDETFALLQEFGIVLQVDVVEILNRASDRRAVLDDYLTSLKGAGSLAERKLTELGEQENALNNKKKEQKKVLREAEKKLKEALRNEDYGSAGDAQPAVIEAESELAKTDTELGQVKDIAARFEDLVDIAKERIKAIESNREVLIAGLKVVEVPGVEDLGVFDENRSFRRSRNEDNDIFGTQYIR